MAPATRLSLGHLAKDAPRILDIVSRAISPSNTLENNHSRRDAAMISIPNTYTHIVSSPAIVVAIVFATVVGFIVVMWVLALVFSPRVAFQSGDTGTVISSETSLSTYARNRYRRRRREMSEAHTAPTASRMSDGEAFAEVYDEEEYDSPPQSPKRTHRRGGGYRSVDPREYAGGGRTVRHVR